MSELEFGEITARRGGVRFTDSDAIVAIGGWCAPGFVLDVPPAEFGPIPPCDGVNHRWARATSFCHECHQAVGPRRLECEACDAILSEDIAGLPAGHFDRLWKTAGVC